MALQIHVVMIIKRVLLRLNIVMIIKRVLLRVNLAIITTKMVLQINVIPKNLKKTFSKKNFFYCLWQFIEFNFEKKIFFPLQYGLIIHIIVLQFV